MPDEAITPAARPNGQASGTAPFDEMLLILSHDLAQPFASIAWLTELLLDAHGPTLPPDARRSLLEIDRVAANGRRLLQAFVKSSTLGSGQEEEEWVDVGGLLQEVHDALEDLLHQKGGRVRVGSDLPAVRTVRLCLFQVVQNIVSNGIKYGAARGPEVVVRACPGLAGLEIVFDDNGPGANPQLLDALYHAPVEPSHDGRSNGTGIGQMIVARCVRRMQAEIRAAPRAAGGTSVRLLLPPRCTPTALPQVAASVLLVPSRTHATSAAQPLPAEPGRTRA